ncbi:MAG TPA: thioredoxin family protein [Kiritimatiellia bacterium]|nr:thioredoxin family protein [Kiritimatiellia bacterium]HRZ11071.1 thioredoxin family protein [Kiritimatiellia bacterium]HSA18644.1 thioredoxin family protein [Kiritimatiellia bacterium]
MSRINRPGLLIFAAATLGFAAPARSDSIEWCDSRAAAVEQALNSGRLILLLAGRESCGNCHYMKYTVCETNSVRSILDADYVCWFCPVDTSTEENPYTGGLGSYTLPLICVIDPGNPLAYLDRTTGIQYEPTFVPRLLGHLPPVTAAVERIEWTENGALRVVMSGATGFSYRVLSADSLAGSWRTNGAAAAGPGGVCSNDLPPSAAGGFFKVIGFR